MLRALIEPLLLPPLNCFALGLLGLALSRWKRRAGIALMATAFVCLWLLSTPLVSVTLLRSLQTSPAIAPGTPHDGIGAIVVISADLDRQADEYGGPVPGALGLQRLRYGAELHRRTGLPILVSGGAPDADLPAHGDTMRDLLVRDFGMTPRWVESRAADTWENATRSAELLRKDGIDRVYLVTHAWHMPRARYAFEATGLEVVPAPTGFRSAPENVLAALVPRWNALRDAGLACHEILGNFYYRILR